MVWTPRCASGSSQRDDPGLIFAATLLRHNTALGPLVTFAHFTSERQNRSIRSSPFSMFARLVA